MSIRKKHCNFNNLLRLFRRGYNDKSKHKCFKSKLARLAGYGLLLMAILAIFANAVVLNGLVIPNDAAETANNIIENEMLFRSGIISFLIVLILDVLVAWALFVY